jgi:hypothetical protein
MSEERLSARLLDNAANFIDFLRRTPDDASEDYKIVERLLQGAREAREREEALQWDIPEKYGVA